MPLYKADLHIHTVLSPCGSLNMSPRNILQAAINKGLDIIGITDHNSTLQCKSMLQAAKNHNITVFCGVEITSKEEVHCLAFFKDMNSLNTFQYYLDKHLPNIPNQADKFGYQLVVDKDENILHEEPRWLVPAIRQSINQVADMVHQLEGVFIPAHINKTTNSLISQLGFIPSNLQADAFEISKHINRQQIVQQHTTLETFSILQNSDAHYIEDIGSVYNTIEMKELSFAEFKLALKQKNNRRIIA